MELNCREALKTNKGLNCRLTLVSPDTYMLGPWSSGPRFLYAEPGESKP
jgi:hypothetical protein